MHCKLEQTNAIAMKIKFFVESTKHAKKSFEKKQSGFSILLKPTMIETSFETFALPPLRLVDQSSPIDPIVERPTAVHATKSNERLDDDANQFHLVAH